MNKIKELIRSITKKGWIISGIVLLIVIILGLTVWPLSIFGKRERSSLEIDKKTEEFVQDVTAQVFTKENVMNGEYRNDVEGATTYVRNTQEVQVAVVADAAAQKVLEDTKKVSCGQIAFVTTRVAYPAVLTNTLKALFENKVAADFTPGNIIPLYHPDLTLQKVMIDSGVAKVYLGGSFNGEKDGWCGASLAIAQIVETAKTFPNVSSVEVYQGDKKVY
ncbi:MAG: hypothetical protein RLY49_147 [Candidatus Parcubacteria bacterium]|jgi:hypothetical protein